MADNISLKCRHWTKNKPIEMVRLFKKVYDSHVAETIALEPHSNYLSLRMLTNLKFTQGNVHPAGYFVQKMAKVSCMLEAGWSITGTGNGNQQVSLSVRIVWSGFVFQMLVKYIWCHHRFTVVFYSWIENSQRIELEEICCLFFKLFSCFSYFISILMKHLLREKNYPFYTIALLALHGT